MTKGIVAVAIASALLMSGSAYAGQKGGTRGGASATAVSVQASVGAGYVGSGFGVIGGGAGINVNYANVKGNNDTTGSAYADGGYKAGGKATAPGYSRPEIRSVSQTDGGDKGGKGGISVSGWTSGGGSASASLGCGCSN
jgi:hypothetical protein